MAIMIRGRVPATEFALAETLSTLSDVEVEVERIVESGEDTVMPLLWVRGVTSDTAAAAFDDDPSVREVSLLSAFDEEEEHLYRMEWVAAIELVLQILTTEEAMITTAVGKGESWYLRALYPTRDDLTETIEYCEANELTIDIESIHEVEGEPGGRYGLSELQYRSLRFAAEAGYYKVPRDITMQEMATDLDVSHQALSERLRRAMDALIAETVLVGPPPEE